MSNRRPRPSKSAATETAEATEATVVEEAVSAPVRISAKLMLPIPEKTTRRGRPSVYNLDAMTVGECFLFDPANLTVVRRAAIAANQKYAKVLGNETRVFRGKTIPQKTKTRHYQVATLSGSDLDGISDEVLQSVFPDAQARPTEVCGCWRVS